MTISSALCLFLGIPQSSIRLKSHTSGRITFQGADHFVSLAHGKDWAAITGEKATLHPPSARDYADAGLPWFDYYGIDAIRLGADVDAMLGGKALAGMTSLSTLFKETTGSELAWTDDVETPKPVALSPRFREVKSSDAV